MVGVDKLTMKLQISDRGMLKRTNYPKISNIFHTESCNLRKRMIKILPRTLGVFSSRTEIHPKNSHFITMR